MTAGYSGTPLVKKLGIKGGFRLALLHAPAHYIGLLGALPEDVTIDRELTSGRLRFRTRLLRRPRRLRSRV